MSAVLCQCALSNEPGLEARHVLTLRDGNLNMSHFYFFKVAAFFVFMMVVGLFSSARADSTVQRLPSTMTPFTGSELFHCVQKNADRQCPIDAIRGVFVQLDDFYSPSDPIGNDCGKFKRAYASASLVGAIIYLPARELHLGSSSSACQIVMNTGPVTWEGQGWFEANQEGDSGSAYTFAGTTLDIPTIRCPHFCLAARMLRGQLLDILCFLSGQRKH